MTIDTKCVHVFLNDKELAALSETQMILKRISALINDSESVIVNQLTGECIDDVGINSARGIVSMFTENDTFFAMM